ncbi:MAG: sigma54 specific transcriptional regulator, Fis family [Betaproteobacteria bacterium]|nr:sigma54 specific transcriptional regulator, Fis family [Betaproteobacteria bacterium]
MFAVTPVLRIEDRSQEALRMALGEIQKSEAELHRIVDAIPQYVNVLSRDGRMLYAGRQLLEFTGMRPEEVTRDFRERVIHAEDLERLRAVRQLGFSGDVPFELEQRYRRKDGQYRWFRARYHPLRDDQGGVVRWYTTAIDILERRTWRFARRSSGLPRSRRSSDPRTGSERCCRRSRRWRRPIPRFSSTVKPVQGKSSWLEPYTPNRNGRRERSSA